MTRTITYQESGVLNSPAKSIRIFAGPTISHAEAKKYTTAKLCGPVKKGDLYAAVRGGDTACIVIIDGLFETCASVWHKEILWCLDQGVPVIGCSSMGALRAAETSVFGAQGEGMIYEYYKRGAVSHAFCGIDPNIKSEIEAQIHPQLTVSQEHLDWLYLSVYERAFIDDDDVAVAHAPSELGCTPLTDAMADIFFCVMQAPFALQTKYTLLLLAKAMHFKHRSFDRLLAVAGKFGFVESNNKLRDWIQLNAISQKKLDAIQTLNRLNEINVDLPLPVHRRFNETVFWQKYLVGDVAAG